MSAASGWFFVVREPTAFGWAVMTTDFIPAGSFVTEYLGMVVNHLLKLENVQPVMKVPSPTCMDNKLHGYLDAHHVGVDDMLLIDCANQGNVASFIEPDHDLNLVPVSISTNRSIRDHRIGLFASRDIFPNEELHYPSNSRYPWRAEMARALERKFMREARGMANEGDDRGLAQDGFVDFGAREYDAARFPREELYVVRPPESDQRMDGWSEDSDPERPDDVDDEPD
jgi:hypothetical protein